MQFIFALLLFLFGISLSANAQAYERGGRYHSIALGASQFVHLSDSYYFSGNGSGLGRNWYQPTTLQANYQLEFGISEYVGLGFTTGVGFGGSWNKSATTSYSSIEVNVPIGFIANFHFYQLIDDKVNKDIHADKLDIYFGANIGSGLALLHNTYIYSDDNEALAILFGGFQTGIRYYVTEKLAVHVETGYGKSFFTAGITLRPTR
ncbi:hypothetical protein BH09BAC1_BH09BAC1_25250 [soil metagenome]